ncbi:hypothetical protein PICMEDRAFT_165888 [Pichia membranifaciens NRRL Y-2026]|uniref:Uncharacterized protein n=1 Tax=Pichia membranifaciens NRRL Y-2026 TaxID=763406 RepID=A0A1E3NG64_9ASCO|nr:hypothetical protein PICMEDRAFT_165888 [Pichia membranifaciens NRRL Y-2026]ODQ45076.1 hypothetical protein PICMEDRAFT_165888 [Pichia membranifaciens NRRL Y-2026]
MTLAPTTHPDPETPANDFPESPQKASAPQPASENSASSPRTTMTTQMSPLSPTPLSVSKVQTQELQPTTSVFTGPEEIPEDPVHTETTVHMEEIADPVSDSETTADKANQVPSQGEEKHQETTVMYKEHQVIRDDPNSDSGDNSPRRVKLYTLSADKWVDCGTGYCSGKLEPIPHFFVVNESDPKDVLLNSPIRGSTQYQRQQDTLIVWTNEDGTDYALSFQETDGCLQLCEFLIEIQNNKIAPNISLVAIIQSAEGEITEIIAGPAPELPVPSVENLENILDMLTINQFKNRIIGQILKSGGEWLVQLAHIFTSCEDNHQLSNIYCLSDIVKTLVYFNEIDIFELLIQGDILQNVVGILEYEPEFPGLKMNWRDFLNEKVKIKEVIKVNDDAIEEEIRKCFVLRFLKDVVLARLLDDSGLNCISTMIQNKESRILDFMQNNDSFLKELFALYGDDEDEEDDEKSLEKYRRKIDGIKLINQFVLISKTQQPFQRTEFYKALIAKGLMSMIKFSTREKEIESRILVTEVIVTIIEHEILLFKNSNEEMLMNTLINILIGEKNIGLKTQAFEAIKILIDPNNLVESNNKLINDSVNISELVDDSFFSDFYEKSALKLFQPIITIIEDDKTPPDAAYSREDLVTLEDLCELLGFISKFHDSVFSRSFILENHLLKGINKLIAPRFKYQLRLSAVRCLRNIVLLNDEFYTRYIIENDILSGFMQILHESNDYNNLVNSTCLNFLNIVIENLEVPNFQLLRRYLADNYHDILKGNFLGVSLLALPQPPSEPGDAATDNNGDEDNDTDVSTANLEPANPPSSSSTSSNKGKRALETEEQADSDAHGGMTGLHDGIGNSDKKKKMST